MRGGGSHSAKRMVELRCPKCGDVAHIWRSASWLKKNGHIKDLYCPVCKETTKHVEIRGSDD